MNQFVTDKHDTRGPVLSLRPTMVGQERLKKLRWKDTFTDNKAALTETASWFNDKMFLVGAGSRSLKKSLEDRLEVWEREPHRQELKSSKPIVSILKGTNKKIQARQPKMPSVKGDKIVNIGNFFDSLAGKSSNRVRRIKEGFLPISKGA